MKKIIIKGCVNVEVEEDPRTLTQNVCAEGSEWMEASDGDHTFSELYEHRTALFIKVCKYLEGMRRTLHPDLREAFSEVWRSKTHSDGTSYDGWFILGINKKKGRQITYHLPLLKWKETEFAETLDKAPEWDGHTPQDVLERLQKLL